MRWSLDVTIPDRNTMGSKIMLMSKVDQTMRFVQSYASICK